VCAVRMQSVDSAAPGEGLVRARGAVDVSCASGSRAAAWCPLLWSLGWGGDCGGGCWYVVGFVVGWAAPVVFYGAQRGFT